MQIRPHVLEKTAFHLGCTRSIKSRFLFARLPRVLERLNLDGGVCETNIKILEVENTQRFRDALHYVLDYAVSQLRVPVITIDGLYLLFKMDHPYAYPDPDNKNRNQQDFIQISNEFEQALHMLERLQKLYHFIF